MLIRLLVENAIKLGLFHKKEGGEIIISITKTAVSIKIIVAYNGERRQKVAELSEGRQGKEILIVRKYLRLIKEQFNYEYTFEIQESIVKFFIWGFLL